MLKPTDGPPAQATTFEELVAHHLGDRGSPAFLRLCHRASPPGDRTFVAAGWRGVVLATAGHPATSTRGVTVRTVAAHSPAVVERALAGDVAEPAVISAEAGCVSAVLLPTLLALRPEVLDLAFPEGDAAALAEAQVALQGSGYAVLVLGGRIVGLRTGSADVLTLFATHLATECAAVAAPAPAAVADGRLERATLRWAERYFREWRAVVNQRDEALTELARLREQPPEVRTELPQWRTVQAARRARRVARRVPESLRRVRSAAGQDSAADRARIELLGALQAVQERGAGAPAPADVALRVRLEVLARALGVEPGHDALATVHERLRAEPSRSDRWWLVSAVLTGSVPDEAEIAGIQQRVLDGGGGSALQLVMSSQGEAGTSWERTADVEVLTGEILVDISHTVQTTLQSGVQRVVRNTVPTWVSLGAVPVVFDDAARTWRRLNAAERATLAAWSDHEVEATADAGTPTTVVVPDGCQILVPELKPRQPLPALRAASAHSGNEFRWIVYDLIPILAAQFVPDETVAGSVDYVSTLKHAKQLVAISESSAAEFRGFVNGLASQGLTGPGVTHELLPLVPPPAPTERGKVEAGALRVAPGLPLVLCVSSISPHKNQEVLLSAAAQLAAAGAAFELMFVAPNAWHVDGFRRRLESLQTQGVAVSLVRDVGDEALWSLYRSAHCVVLISRVEGYGLPVAEALSVGTPVVTSNFGSMREVAAGGGALMVDPTDVAAVAEAVGSLLEDDALHASLAAAAAARATSSWEQYAARTWSLLLADQGGERPK